VTEQAPPATPVLRSGDLWAGVAVVAAGAVGLVASFDIFQPVGFNSVLGPRAFPIAMSGLLLALGVTLCVRVLLRRQVTHPDIGSRGTLAVMSAAILGYLAIFETLGFTVATALFLTGLFAFLGERRIWVALLAGVALAVAIEVAFTYGLDVALPRGIFGF
jgi:putative tricarboxylic transport membrane protein